MFDDRKEKKIEANICVKSSVSLECRWNDLRRILRNWRHYVYTCLSWQSFKSLTGHIIIAMSFSLFLPLLHPK